DGRAAVPDGAPGIGSLPVARAARSRQGDRAGRDHEVRLHARPRREAPRSPLPSRAAPRVLRGRRDDRAVSPPVAREPAGRRIRRSGDLRWVPGRGRAYGLPPRVFRAVRALVVPGRGSARSLGGPSLRDHVTLAAWRTPAAAVLSGLAFALAFPPFERVLL